MSIKQSRKQIPVGAKRLHRYINNFHKYKSILNFGCGKWPELTSDYLIGKHEHIEVVRNYDPMSSDPLIRDLAQAGGCDVVLVANVLNVLEEKAMASCLSEIANLRASAILFQIYEGDRSGVGRKTRDGYQRNALAANYMGAIEKAMPGYSLTLRSEFIIADAH